MKRKYIRKVQIRTDVPIPENCLIIQVISEETIGRERYTDIKVLNVWAIVEEEI